MDKEPSVRAKKAKTRKRILDLHLERKYEKWKEEQEQEEDRKE